jgi:hypothetical protein
MSKKKGWGNKNNLSVVWGELPMGPVRYSFFVLLIEIWLGVLRV